MRREGGLCLRRVSSPPPAVRVHPADSCTRRPPSSPRGPPAPRVCSCQDQRPAVPDGVHATCTFLTLLFSAWACSTKRARTTCSWGEVVTARGPVLPPEGQTSRKGRVVAWDRAGGGRCGTAGCPFCSSDLLFSLILPFLTFSPPLRFCLVCETWGVRKQSEIPPRLEFPPAASPPSGPTGCGQGLRVVIGVEWGPGGGQARSARKPQAGPPGHVRHWRPRAVLSSQRFELGGVTALPGVSATLLRGGGLPRGEGRVGGPRPAVPVSVPPVCMPPRGSPHRPPRSQREQNQQPPPAPALPCPGCGRHPGPAHACTVYIFRVSASRL